jgi:hypothetical protein
MGHKKNKHNRGAPRIKQVGTSDSLPSPRKVARRSEDPSSTNDMRPAWVFSMLDEHGPWGRTCLKELHVWDDILPKMRNYETMTWGQIEGDHKRNHSVQIGSMCKKARKRVEELKLDIDELFRFRLTGEQRLWGIRDRNVFKLLWWDPGHEVCPSQLKHT